MVNWDIEFEQDVEMKSKWGVSPLIITPKVIIALGDWCFNKKETVPGISKAPETLYTDIESFLEKTNHIEALI